MHMRIIYSGGYDKYNKESVANSFFYRYSKIVLQQIEKGKKAVSINFAKPDRYYNSILEEAFKGKILKIDNINKTKIMWKDYDIIFLPGGSSEWLKNKLIETGFSFDKLKKDVVIIGDSAGAYVMSAYFPSYSDIDSLDKENILDYADKGFYSESNIFTITHVNNQKHVPAGALKLAKKLADKLGVRLLALKENEEKMLLEGGTLVSFDIEKLFQYE